MPVTMFYFDPIKLTTVKTLQDKAEPIYVWKGEGGPIIPGFLYDGHLYFVDTTTKPKVWAAVAAPKHIFPDTKYFLVE